MRGNELEISRRDNEDEINQQIQYTNTLNPKQPQVEEKEDPYIVDLPTSDQSESEHDDMENVNPVKPIKHPFSNYIVDEDDVPDSDDEYEDEYVDQKSTYDQPIKYNPQPDDIFWNMPPLLSNTQPKMKPRSMTIYETSNLVKLNQTFKKKEDFLMQLCTKCVTEGFQIKPKYSDKLRCIQDSNNFQIRKLNDLHTCSITQILPNNRHATKKVLGNILKEVMKQEGRVYRPNDIRTDMYARFKISLSYHQAWKAKCYTIEMLRGSLEDSFQVLPNYLYNLRLSNPSSVTNIRTDNEGRFVMSYMSIGAATRSFVNYARPVIIVDGAHLKSRYLGTNLIDVAMDANNGILPLAYGIEVGETTDHWTWFFGNLRHSLQSSGCCINNLTIISDRAPAIAAGISIIFPEVFHALCARHLLGNLKSVSKRVKSYEWHYWKMYKAYRKSNFDHYYGILSRRIPDSTRTLTTVGLNIWSRHHADHVWYAYLTTNTAESMNALSVHARKLPVTMLLEFCRASVQQWFWEHRNTADGLTTPVTPYAERKLGKRNRKSLIWTVKPISQVKFEVMDMKKGGKVNLQDKTCTCKQWQFSGLPCGHVMAVARYFVLRDVTTHVQKYFHTETYKSAYMEDINLLDHISE
ncbi:uncharacterized protein [Rutidosis leptorrhynchoides]|uniref:uncharacterized protein n=1 Tax=Rutidosis leptorrhynchoides TaxID=125765 RepID=UPI003A9A0189